MTVYNLGSINYDNFFQVVSLPGPGETILSSGHRRDLGGKGANQSIAARKTGAQVFHIGVVGDDGDNALAALESYGIDVSHVSRSELPTGQATVLIDKSGENQIVVSPGANLMQTEPAIAAALADAKPTDRLLLQNETTRSFETAKLAKSKGMHVTYSAAPFDAEMTKRVLPYVDTLALNAIEVAQLAGALQCTVAGIPVPEVLVTQGSAGVQWRGKGGEVIEMPAMPVSVVDTTGAGDTFLGYFEGGRDLGFPVEACLIHANAAAALKVSKAGTSSAIPGIVEVKTFINAES